MADKIEKVTLKRELFTPRDGRKPLLWYFLDVSRWYQGRSAKVGVRPTSPIGYSLLNEDVFAAGADTANFRIVKGAYVNSKTHETREFTRYEAYRTVVEEGREPYDLTCPLRAVGANAQVIENVLKRDPDAFEIVYEGDAEDPHADDFDEDLSDLERAAQAFKAARENH